MRVHLVLLSNAFPFSAFRYLVRAQVFGALMLGS